MAVRPTTGFSSAVRAVPAAPWRRVPAVAVSKGVVKYPKGAWRIAEPVGDLSGWQPPVKIGAQSLVLALLRGGWFGEEAAAFR